MPPRRLYAELQVASQRYEIIYSDRTYSKITMNPGKLNIGYFVAPRVALQAGVLYSLTDISTTGTGTTIDNKPVVDKTQRDGGTISIPVLLRYTLLPLSDRLTVDLLGGITFSRFRSHYNRVTTEGTETTLQIDYEREGTNLYITGGSGLRYALGKAKRLEGLLDITISKNSKGLSTSTHKLLEAPLGVTSAYSIGIRYNIL